MTGKTEHWVDGLAARAALAILLYFALQAALRVLTPGGLGLDEAQILLHAQSLEPGYGPQPPLYAWLQIGVFALTGPGVAGIAILKALILATTPIALWLTVRAAGGAPRAALLAALIPFLTPAFAWEAQRALTHTPLALALLAAALPAFAAARRGGLGAHLLFGLICGAALIAKWNAAFPAAGLLAVMLLDPGGPRSRPLAALAAMAAVAAGPLAWAALNPEVTLADTRKFGLEPMGAAAARLAATAAFAEATAAMLALPVAALAALFARARPSLPAADPALRRDLTRAFALALAAVFAALLISGATEIKERWLTPLGLLAVVPAALWLQPRLEARRLARAALLAGALAAAAAVALQINWRIGSGRPSYQAAPFAALGPEALAGAGTILAENDWIGGNLRLIDPSLPVLTPATPALGIATPGPVRLIWREGAAPPEALLALHARRFGAPPDLSPPRTAAAPYPPPHGETGFALRRADAR